MTLYRVKARQKGVTGYINCLRGTWLGNPFPLNKYTLNNSLLLYKEYLKWRITNDEVFREYLKGLYEKAKNERISLGCTCNIQDSCHVDILIDQIHHWFWKESNQSKVRCAYCQKFLDCHEPDTETEHLNLIPCDYYQEVEALQIQSLTTKEET